MTLRFLRVLMGLSVGASSLLAGEPDTAHAIPLHAVIAERSTAMRLANSEDGEAAENAAERMMLLGPAGPLVIEATITAEGQPYRRLREELLEKMLARADSNRDGKPTWEEALKSPRFSFGRLRVTNEQQREAYLKTYDLNNNGLVDRDEAREVLKASRTAAFSVYGIKGSGSGFQQRVVLPDGRVTAQYQPQVDLLPVLDRNNDRMLSANEIAGAGERLKMLDADDNDLLYSREILTAVRTNASGQQNDANPQVLQARRSLVVRLGPTASARELHQTLLAHYSTNDSKLSAASFSHSPDLFKVLDENRDHELQEEEVLNLLRVKPDVHLTVDLGPAGKGLKAVHVAPPVEVSEPSGDALACKFRGLELKVTMSRAPASYVYDQRFGQSYIDRLDKDKNGYLENSELPGTYSRTIEMWDGNNDGKVFPEEIVESYIEMQAPYSTQVRANVTLDGSSLFRGLDLSGDYRLSLREMRTAHLQLKTFDKNADGTITLEEIQSSMELKFVLGVSYLQTGQSAGKPAPEKLPKTNPPEWFTHMDRNGDGDLTLQEFLGDKPHFHNLDENKDGFIELKEAQSAHP